MKTMKTHNAKLIKSLMILFMSLMSLMFFISGCKKENSNTPLQTNSEIIFYSDDFANRWGIIFDGVDRGSVAQSNTEPNCGDSFFQNYSILSGEHTLKIYSMSGLADKPERIILISGCTKYNVR